MTWSYNLGRYSMTCRIIGDPVKDDEVAVVVQEGQNELHREAIRKAPAQDASEFVAGVYRRVWALQTEYLQRAMNGHQREWERQANEG
jgi:23S rRNA maturation mini-RNase III